MSGLHAEKKERNINESTALHSVKYQFDFEIAYFAFVTVKQNPAKSSSYSENEVKIQCASVKKTLNKMIIAFAVHTM